MLSSINEPQVVIVHGAGGALGSAVARAFVRRGARLFLTGIRDESLGRTCHSISSEGVAMSTPIGPGVTARNGPTLRETSGMSGYRLAVEASSGQGWVSGPENHPGGVHHERARHRPMGHTAFGRPQGPSQ